jgi:hypothetical protein
MADKKESPESEHFESDIKSDPSVFIPVPGSARQPYGESGITSSTFLYTHSHTNSSSHGTGLKGILTISM